MFMLKQRFNNVYMSAFFNFTWETGTLFGTQGLFLLYPLTVECGDESNFAAKKNERSYRKKQRTGVPIKFKPFNSKIYSEKSHDVESWDFAFFSDLISVTHVSNFLTSWGWRRTKGHSLHLVNNGLPHIRGRYQLQVTQTGGYHSRNSLVSLSL